MQDYLWNDPSVKMYFRSSEFDSPDVPGSGVEMQYGFIDKLIVLRRYVDRPFIINSGFRTQAHNKNLLAKGYKASIDSPHLKGLAADIKILDSAFLYKLLKYCFYFKVRRIGISTKGNFVHVDISDDKDKGQDIIWGYD